MKQLLAVLMCLGMMLSVTAHAAGDVSAGRVKAETCLGCHGIKTAYNAYPSFKVPKLGGQHAAYLVSAMKSYKDGLRDHETMYGNVESLSEQDMLDIAAYFEQDSQ